MDRTTKPRTVSEFTFSRDEIEHLGLESEMWDFMEGLAREDLRVAGLPYMGGIVSVDFGYDMRPTILTLTI